MLTYEEAKAHIEQLKEAGYNYFCSNCLSGMEKTKEGILYCPNESCLEDEEIQS